MLRFPTSVLLIGLATACTAHGASIAVFNTGESAGGTALPAGQTDPHYTVISAPAGVPLTAIATTPNPLWTPNTATADWINPFGVANVTQPVGDYDYQTTFDLAGLDPSTAELSGSWTSDNNSCIYLNGANTGNCAGLQDYGSLLHFSITAGFQPGVNRLDFVVTNPVPAGINPTGVVAEVSGTASPVSGVPEPSSLLPLGGGLLSLFYIARQQRIL